jgi:hypothetical protein
MITFESTKLNTSGRATRAHFLGIRGVVGSDEQLRMSGDQGLEQAVSLFKGHRVRGFSVILPGGLYVRGGYHLQ